MRQHFVLHHRAALDHLREFLASLHLRRILHCAVCHHQLRNFLDAVVALWTCGDAFIARPTRTPFSLIHKFFALRLQSPFCALPIRWRSLSLLAVLLNVLDVLMPEIWLLALSGLLTEARFDPFISGCRFPSNSSTLHRSFARHATLFYHVYLLLLQSQHQSQITSLIIGILQ